MPRWVNQNTAGVRGQLGALSAISAGRASALRWSTQSGETLTRTRLRFGFEFDLKHDHPSLKLP